MKEPIGGVVYSEEGKIPVITDGGKPAGYLYSPQSRTAIITTSPGPAVAGPQGPTGLTGPQGPTGAQGAIGITGDTGPQGVGGSDGTDGAAGPQGPQGTDGTVGPQGPDGPQGLTGDAGPQGSAGPQGTAGLDGPQGAPGPQGADGVEGPQGLDGADGPQGPQGTIGADGPQGPQGVQGAESLVPGPQGDIGASGIAGELPSGYADTITPVGTTSATLEETGLEASVTLEGPAKIAAFASFELATQGGGGSASVIALALEIDGVVHDEVQRYLSGTNDQGIGTIVHRSSDTLFPAGTYTAKLLFRRVSGSVTPGINVADLLVLGLQGAVGPQGPDGAQGVDGAQGADGAQGDTGAQGAPGPQGNDGALGPQGVDGAQGAAGADGPQGADGADGPQGADGADGPQGNDGAQGDIGPQGPQGADGSSTPLTGTITKILDVGEDFDTPAEMMAWLNETKFADARIIINVGVGAYSWPADVGHTLDYPGVRKISFIGSGTATCTWNFPYTVTSLAPFNIRGMFVDFSGITFMNSLANVGWLTEIHAGSWVRWISCNINAFPSVGYVYGSRVYMSNVLHISDPGGFDAVFNLSDQSYCRLVGGNVFSGLTNGWCAFYVEHGSTVECQGSNSITGYDLGFDVSKQYYILQRGTLTFTSVNTNYPSPMNEIQGDGSYVTDGNLDYNGVKSKSIIIEDPGASEDLSFLFTDKAITLTKMRAILTGSATPSVTWTVRHGTDRSGAGAEAVTGGTVTTETTTGSDVTSFDDDTIVADSHVWIETTAQSGTVDSIIITLFYTED